MSDMEAEVEEVSFLPGEKILNKKAVYEPSSSQRCRQLVCSRQWAVAIVVTMGIFILIIAIIAAFARPSPVLCSTAPDDSHASTLTPASSSTPKEKSYISTDGRPFPWKSIRLPRDVIPESYEIFLHPNISLSRFQGKVTIHCTVVNPTDSIVLHVKELNVTKVSVLRGEVGVGVADTMEYTENEQLWVKVKQTLAGRSKVVVVVEFAGALISKLAGFYKSSYKTSAGETREIATTHFEATDARAAFPCFDEPDLKANFTLSMVREHRHISLFNMPLKASVAHGDGLMQDNYETSVKMSTYLVAFVVCDFKNVTSHTNNKQKTMVRVFAPEDQIDQAHYALEVAVKVLDYYNDFFGVPYPLPKQDMIAIPDFSAGAMENWGLITYRMTSILYDPSKTSASGKQWIAVVIAHELAHQWFGNIVTMKWWDDLWLNEGFASFVEYMGAGKAEPSFGMREQFVYQTLQQALYLDSFTNSHPIQVPVNDPAEISAIFDKISYDKGASLIAMVQAFIGENNFKQGLHDYLTAHAYSNARTADLWDSLQKASSMDSSMTVKDVMDTWTLQMGYPVVTVKRKPGTNQITLSQERFLLSYGSDKNSKYTSPYNYTWKVPFTYRTKSNPKQQLVWLTEKEMTLPTPLSEGDWIKGNMLTGGFYRVNYEPSLWRLIIQDLQDLKTNKDVLSVRDRAGLLDDAFSLARAGLLSYDIALELLAYLAQETEYVPMVTAISSYSFVSARLLVTHVFPKVEKYMLNLISNRLHALNWTNHDQHLAKLLQGSLISRAVSLGDKASIHRAQQLFKAGNWTNIPDNLRATVYNTAVEYGDDETWEQVFRAYTASNVPTEKKQFLYALTQTRDPRRIQLFLRDTLNDKVIRSQDSESVISGIASQDTGHLFAWRFVQQNWDALYKMYGDTSFQLSGLVKSVVAPFNTQFDFHEVSEFFKDKNLGPGKMALQQSLETVNTHISWAAKHQDNITQWFKTHVKDNE